MRARSSSGSSACTSANFCGMTVSTPYGLPSTCSSIDALAEAADRTSGAVYAHFGGKEGVLVALLDELKDAVAAAIVEESDTDDDDDQHLAVLWRNFVTPPPLAGDVWVLLEHELWLY